VPAQKFLVGAYWISSVVASPHRRCFSQSVRNRIKTKRGELEGFWTWLVREKERDRAVQLRQGSIALDDSEPLATRLRFEDGTVANNKRGEFAAGLALSGRLRKAVEAALPLDLELAHLGR
jgi:hypothetical protein